MIMSGTTPRSLTWGGCVTLLATAVFLLPVLPIWAQTEEIQKDVEAGLKAAREAQLKKEIELMESRLKDLKELKGTQDPRVREEAAKALHNLAQKDGKEQKIQEVHAEIQRLSADLAQARAQMQRAEAQLTAAHARLAELQAATHKGDGEEALKHAHEWLKATQGSSKARVITITIDETGTAHIVESQPAQGRTKGPFTSAAPADVNKRIQELERKLDELVKEVHRMYQERQPGKSGKSPATSSVEPLGERPIQLNPNEKAYEIRNVEFELELKNPLKEFKDNSSHPPKYKAPEKDKDKP